MKSFQQVLKNRVKNSQKIIPDKYTLKKALEEIIREMFGDLGAKKIFISSQEDQKVILTSFQSIWCSELRLHLEEIKKKLNQKIPQTSEIKIIIFRKK